MSEEIRVAVVGAGGIAQMMHLPHLSERPDHYKIQTLVDLSEETLSIVGDRYQVPKRTRDLNAALSDPEIDAVLIFASGNHRSAIEQAAAAHKHVMVEKPMAYDLDEALALSKIAKNAGDTFMVAYHKRFDPHYQRAMAEISQMKDLRYVEATVLHPDDGAYRTHHVVWPNPDGRLPGKPEPEERAATVERVTKGDASTPMQRMCMAGAPISHRVAALFATESLIHDINALRGILGEPEEVLSANIWQDGFAQSSHVRFKNDVHANLSWISLPGLRNYEQTLRFVSTEKRVTLIFPSPYLRNMPTRLIIERGEGQELTVEEVLVSHEEAFALELRHFRDCVLTKRRPHLTEDDAVADARFIQMIANAYR